MWPVAIRYILIGLDLLLLLSPLTLSDLTDPSVLSGYTVNCCKFALRKGSVSHAQTSASDLSLLMFLRNHIVVCWFFLKKHLTLLEVLVGVQ